MSNPTKYIAVLGSKYSLSTLVFLNTFIKFYKKNNSIISLTFFNNKNLKNPSQPMLIASNGYNLLKSITNNELLLNLGQNIDYIGARNLEHSEIYNYTETLNNENHNSLAINSNDLYSLLWNQFLDNQSNINIIDNNIINITNTLNNLSENDEYHPAEYVITTSLYNNEEEYYYFDHLIIDDLQLINFEPFILNNINVYHPNLLLPAVQAEKKPQKEKKIFIL